MIIYRDFMMAIQDRLMANRDYIIKSYQEGASTNTLGKEFKCNPGTIWYFLNKLKVPTRKRKNYGSANNQENDIVQLYGSGKSCYEIGKALNISKANILKKLHKLGVDTSTYRTGNPDNLLKDKTDLVIELFHQGFSCGKIAKQVGHAESAIWRLLDANGIDMSDWKYHVDEEYFKAIDTQEKAYILGWFYSDGNVRIDRIRIGLAEKDSHILEWMKGQMKYDGPLHFVPRVKPHHQDIIELCINRKALADDLTKLGCVPAKSKILQFPTEEQVPRDLLSHFVRGYFDGDGSISNGVMIVGSYDFTYGLKEVLPCYVTNIYQRYKSKAKEDSAHQLFIGRKEEIAKLSNWMYHDATMCLSRKRF
jgi:DNA-binding CsgD family transcriptional regulator